jgi:3-oxoacyl-[acyl-carrier protein] reductase
MDLGLKGKTALVTAASKGLGKAAALALAREGADLTICARTEGDLNATADEIRRTTGVEVLAVPTDLSKAADIDKLVQAALDHFGRLDILFTNSGGRPPGLFWELSDDDWYQAVEGTLMAAIRLIRSVLPAMREQRWGRIICSSSVAAKQPLDNLILSNAIFAAIHGLAKTLANNLATEGITVNCINPGPILTDRIRELSEAQAKRENISVEEALASWGQATRMKRAGDPMEFGNVVAFLASDRAGFLTGVSVSVDGGACAGLL